MKVAIMTDTNSGISVSEGAELGVHVLPMPVLIDGKIYYEGVDLLSEEFYASLREGRDVTTSQPSPGDVLAMWENILASNDALVYVPMSSGLSTSCQTAVMLSQDYNGRVQVADNHSISVPMRYCVMDALELARAGWSAVQIKEALEGIAGDTHIYIGVDTLEYLKKGGRITPAAAAMGTILQLKPLLKIEGDKLDAFAKVRGTLPCKRRLIAEMRPLIERCEQSGYPFSVAAAGTFPEQAEAEEWIQMAREAFPGYEIRYDPLSFSIGAHTGPGAFGMAVSRRVSPNDLRPNESLA